jgi:hypothetical protein
VSTNLPPEERLALTRARMRLALHSEPKAHAHASSATGPGWMDALKSEPVAGIVLEALRQWWQQHPLRTAGTLVAQAVQSTLAPVAQRNPVALVLAAFVVGGLLALAKPWRWIPVSAIFVGVVPQILAKWVAQVPTSTWMSGLDAFLRQGSKSRE